MRINKVSPGTIPELNNIESEILKQRGRISPLYQVLLNSPDMASGWEKLLTAVRNKNSLPDLDKEILIIRVAVLNEAIFEYEAHVPIAIKAGADQDLIKLISSKTIEKAQLNKNIRFLVDLADSMTLNIKVEDDVYSSGKSFYSNQQMLDAILTVAAYNMVSRFLVALEITH